MFANISLSTMKLLACLDGFSSRIVLLREYKQLPALMIGVIFSIQSQNINCFRGHKSFSNGKDL
jgi:hypothetical protein